MLALCQNGKKKLAAAMVLGLVTGATLVFNSGWRMTQAYIIQGQDLASAQAAVQGVGGKITQELGIVRAVGARLSPQQRRELEKMANLRVHEYAGLRTGHSQAES